jgi:hypothetical protein
MPADPASSTAPSGAPLLLPPPIAPPAAVPAAGCCCSSSPPSRVCPRRLAARDVPRARMAAVSLPTENTRKNRPTLSLSAYRSPKNSICAPSGTDAAPASPSTVPYGSAVGTSRRDCHIMNGRLAMDSMAVNSVAVASDARVLGTTPAAANTAHSTWYRIASPKAVHPDEMEHTSASDGGSHRGMPSELMAGRRVHAVAAPKLGSRSPRLLAMHAAGAACQTPQLMKTTRRARRVCIRVLRDPRARAGTPVSLGHRAPSPHRQRPSAQRNLGTTTRACTQREVQTICAHLGLCWLRRPVPA